MTQTTDWADEEAETLFPFKPVSYFQDDAYRQHRAKIAAALCSAHQRGRDESAAETKWLGELLAIIHCDGGHHQQAVGSEQAVNDAHGKWTALVAEVERLRGHITAMLKDFDALVADSEGVYGFHRNGDPAPWSELTEGGRFEEWTLAFEFARSALGDKT